MNDEWLDGVDGEIPTVDLEGLKAETKRLIELDDAAYELERAQSAKRYKVRPSYFDGQRKKARPKPEADDDAKGEEAVEALEPWDEPVNGAALADEIRDRLRAHVVFERATDADALAVWVLGAHAMDIWGLFPKVLITAPEKQCGKTTLLNVLSSVTPRALAASNATPAAIFRGIEVWKPTLLLDEIDTWAHENPELRGVINSGHERDQAFVLRCVGDNHEPRRFSTWCPMVLSGIGTPKDTVVSRSLVIGLRRRLPSEPVQRRPVDLRQRMERARRQSIRWIEDNRILLGAMDSEPPECGDDRRRDNFTPLWRVAAALGGDWPSRIEAAYLAGVEADEADESAGVMLLRDMMEMVKRQWPHPKVLTSADVVSALIADDEKPWHEWRRGKPATARTFSKLLKPYGIEPRTVRADNGTTPKGYAVAELQEAFNRYVAPVALSNPPQRHNVETRGKSANPIRHKASGCGGYEAEKAEQYQSCGGVADTKPPQGDDDDLSQYF